MALRFKEVDQRVGLVLVVRHLCTAVRMCGRLIKMNRWGIGRVCWGTGSSWGAASGSVNV